MCKCALELMTPPCTTSEKLTWMHAKAGNQNCKSAISRIARSFFAVVDKGEMCDILRSGIK